MWFRDGHADRDVTGVTLYPNGIAPLVATALLPRQLASCPHPVIGTRNASPS
jgi:hypothetical protein